MGGEGSRGASIGVSLDHLSFEKSGTPTLARRLRYYVILGLGGRRAFPFLPIIRASIFFVDASVVFGGARAASVPPSVSTYRYIADEY